MSRGMISLEYLERVFPAKWSEDNKPNQWPRYIANVGMVRVFVVKRFVVAGDEPEYCGGVLLDWTTAAGRVARPFQIEAGPSSDLELLFKRMASDITEATGSLAQVVDMYNSVPRTEIEHEERGR